MGANSTQRPIISEISAPQRYAPWGKESVRRRTVAALLALIMLAAISGNIQAGEPGTNSDQIAAQRGTHSSNNSPGTDKTSSRASGASPRAGSRRDYIEDEVLVLISADTDPAGSANSAENLQDVEKSVGGTVKRRISLSQKSRNARNRTKYPQPGSKRELLVVKLPKGKSVKDAIAERWDAKDSRILSVQPNYYVETLQVPNDPRFSQMWGLNNTGQTGGLAGVDIDALSAWNTTTGSSSVIVAVIDSGIDYTHPDLSENIWINTGEIAGNGIDDDGNGYVDDIYGYDFEGNDSDPQDDLGHGTHCAGTIAAGSNNAIGITGVSWHSQLMACRFIGAGGYGLISDAIEAVNYAVANGADILSNSWGWQGGPSDALEAAIINARDNGVLFVAAAGNESANNDNTSFYPANYRVSNVISVAAIDHNGELAGFSNYGSQSVHLGAPGVSILSTVPGNSYAWYSGTSMAAPHVSGVAALLLTRYPQISMAELKSRIISTGTPAASLQGKTTSGRYLNAYNALATGPETRVTTPNGGEQWYQDRSHTITWSSIGGGQTVDVYLLRNGTVHSQLADDISNEGMFVWQVPGNIQIGSDYTILVDDGTTTDESDAAFAITEAPDNLTEMFRGQSDIFDLSNKSVLFKPANNSSGYTGHARDITALPTDPAGGLQLTLGDDDSRLVTLDNASVSLYDRDYSSFYIGSNGFITFTGPDATYYESLAIHFDTPRISVLFDDFSPDQNGTVSWKQLPDRAVVTWQDVTQYRADDRSTFQAELFFDGRIQISWLSVQAQDGITGLSEGLGLPAGFQETDLSEYPRQDYNEALTGYWKFDDYNGISAFDSSGNGNAGNLINGVAWNGPDGIRLDGNDDAVKIPASALNLDAATISLWVFPEDTSGLQHLFGHFKDSNNDLQLYMIGGILNVHFGSSIAVGVDTLAPESWHHLVIAWTRTTYTVYVSGLEKASGQHQQFTALNTWAYVGNDGRQQDNAFKGLIDEVKVFDMSLSAEDVSKLFITENIKENRDLSMVVTQDNSEITYSIQDAQSLPSGATFNPNTATFEFRPWYDQAGSYKIIFEGMDDNSNLQDIQSLIVVVEDVAMSPWYKTYLEHLGTL